MDLIVGDIHNCWREFRALLDRAGLGDEDSIIAVGDVYDRGPDPVALLDFFAVERRGRSVLGNHERRHYRGADGLCPLALSQRLTREMFGPRYGEALAYFRTLPLWVETPHALVVHAWFDPLLPLDAQPEARLAGVMSERIVRDAEGIPLWVRDYPPDALPVVVGHVQYPRIRLAHNVWAIDTGCCDGGSLTGLLLPEERLIQVPAAQRYWAIARQAARRSEHLGPLPRDASLKSWYALRDALARLVEDEESTLAGERLAEVGTRIAELESARRDVIAGATAHAEAIAAALGYQEFAAAGDWANVARRIPQRCLARLLIGLARGVAPADLVPEARATRRYLHDLKDALEDLVAAASRSEPPGPGLID
jgi:hypothetical protein